MESIEHNSPIPDNWFGGDTLAIKIGKDIWDSDIVHDIVLHPYVFTGNNVASVFVEIALTKKLRLSDDYFHLVKSVFSMVNKHLPEVNLVNINFYFRDSLEELAHLLNNKEMKDADYKDEKSKKHRLLDISNLL